MSVLANAGKANIGKTNMYVTNGSGRDTYVGYNNGGNTASSSMVKAVKKNMFFNHKGYVRDDSPGKKPLYKQDGSGRDSYISSNNGGFTCTGAGSTKESDIY